jgi:DNA-binding SARP family transcriptional activator
MRGPFAEVADSPSIEVHLLGEVAVIRHGATVALPPSKKTRALLAYLVVTSGPQSRQRLCDLLWDGPDDPRAALRWSLAKLRPVLDEEGAARLVADRERVAFEAHGARIDLFEALAHTAPGVASASTGALRRAAESLSGEFLEGLEMPDCYRFHEWCTAQRERVRALRLSVLDALVERGADDSPEEALRYARHRLAVDALSDVAHATVVRLLARLGRNAEALAQVDACRRILDRELGGRRSPALEIARSEIGKASPTRGERSSTPVAQLAPQALAPVHLASQLPSPKPARRPPTLVARAVERSVLADFVRFAN